MNGRMTAMSVFNSWDTQASQRGLEAAAQKVAGSVEKTTGKLSTDIKQSSDKITTAIKENTDAVKRTTTNASMTAPVAAIHTGLRSIADSADCIAEYLVAHPNEMGAAAEAATAVGQQFGALVKAATQFDEGNAQLKGMVGEMAKTLDWVDYKFSSGDENNQNRAMPPSGTFSGATLPVVCNAAAIAPPINDLILIDIDRK